MWLCVGINADLLARTESQRTCQVHSESECNSTTKAGTVAATKARIYDIIGWANTGNGYNTSKNRCWTLNLYMKWECFSGCRVCISWIFGTGGYTFFETVCLSVCVCELWSRCSVKRMKNGQEYFSVLRVQFSMNQKQLSWLPFHILPSARKCDFFHIFLQVKSLQNGIKWGIFSLLKCWKFGAD